MRESEDCDMSIPNEFSVVDKIIENQSNPNSSAAAEGGDLSVILLMIPSGISAIF